MAPNVNDKELRENGNPDSRGYEIFFEQKQAADRLFTFNEGSKEATVNVIAEKTNEHYNTIAAILANLQLAMMKLENLKKLEINEDTKNYLEHMIEMTRQESFLTRRLSDVLIDEA